MIPSPIAYVIASELPGSVFILLLLLLLILLLMLVQLLFWSCAIEKEYNAADDVSALPVHAASGLDCDVDKPYT